LFENIDLCDSFIKSPNKGFYSFPYSYKPTEIGSTHVKQENFNPDFFIKYKDKNEILVVEIKDDQDITQKNRAKLRDGLEHFNALNQKLNEEKIGWQYFFYFLSPDDIPAFFQAVRDNHYQNWKSSLMQELK
jgi:type III restriction enzyme